MFKKTIIKMYRSRIESGLSQCIPGRKNYIYFADEYAFFIASCTVYIYATHSFFDLSVEIFSELIHSYWNEHGNDRYHHRFCMSKEVLAKDENGTSYFEDFPDTKSESPEKACLIKDRNQRLLKRVESLKPNKRGVIKDIYFNYKTEKDVAEKNGTSQANVHYLKAAALKDLAKNYIPEDEME